MMIKYRIHEVAKDFEIQSKEVVDLLKDYFEEPKKSMTALVEEELDVIFDVLTKNHAVESFDHYFELGEKARAERAAKRDAEKAAKLAQQAEIAAMLAAQKAAAAGETKAEAKPAKAEAAAIEAQPVEAKTEVEPIAVEAEPEHTPAPETPAEEAK